MSRSDVRPSIVTQRVIKAGADQLDQGLIVDGDAFFEEWDAELDELETTSQQRTG